MHQQLPEPEELAALEKTAIDAAKSAGEIVRRGFGASAATLNVTHKGEVDLVTSVDLAAERAVVAVIRERYPSHAILAEEVGAVAGDAEALHWLVDPLDGTTNFAHRHPHCAVSIACLRGETPVVGVIYDPMREELFTVRAEGPPRLNGKTIAVSDQPQLSQSLLATGFAYDRRERPEAYIPLFRAFMCAGQGVRRMGAAALDLAWVACGRLDGYWEANLNSWDVAAGAFLVQRAGGRVTTYDGGCFNVMQPARIVASNSQIHSEMLKVLEASNAKGETE